MTYQEVCDYIEGIARFSVKNSNEHTRKCLAALGDPDRNFDSIHIAGTNGKGSTCAFLASVMKMSGRRTGFFTSPHLIELRERLMIDGEMISKEEFVLVFEEVQSAIDRIAANGEARPSYFEFIFLMCCVWFAKKKVDIAIIETGLGGRLDATNSLEAPILSVIASISFDHMQYLGTTIPEIASEKAGIIRAGVPVVCDGNKEDAVAVIRARAHELGTICRVLAPEDYHVTRYSRGEIDFYTAFGYDGNNHFTIRSAAPYQTENASLAVLAVQTLKETNKKYADLSCECVRAGLLEMKWPGRMEEIAPKVYLDGGHNEDGIIRFAEAAKAICGNDAASLIFSVVNDKDFTEMIRILAEIPWKRIYVTEIQGSRKTESEELQRLFALAGRADAQAYETFADAYRKGLAEQGDDYLFICGSLYLAGEAEEIAHD